MARRGRFGRATSGSANLSSFISNLIQNSIQRNESALLNAFSDQTMFGGSVPTALDIEDYVNSRTAGLDPNSSEFAYYQNMLENAKRQERQRTVSAASTAFNASGGESYDEFYSQISGLLSSGDLSAEERVEFEALLTQKTRDYVGIVASEYTAGITSFEDLVAKTDVAIGRLTGQNQENALLERASSIVVRETASLESGAIDVAQFKSMTGIAMRGIEKGSPAAFDIGVGIQAAIWNKEIDKYNVALAKAKNKGYTAKINSNKNWIEWAKTQLQQLEDAGLGESQFASDIKVEIESKRSDLNAAQVAAYNAGYKRRVEEIQSIEASINEMMRNVPLVIGGETKVFSIDQIYGTSVTDSIGTAVQLIRYLDVSPELRAQYDSLMEAYRGASADLYNYASSNGAASEAKFYKDKSKQLRSMTGLDTSMEDYEDAYDIRLDLVSRANGNDASIKAINEQWLQFLSGNNTRYFGKGMAAPKDAFTEQLIANEKAIYSGTSTSTPATGYGATFAGYYNRDVKLPEGYTGTFEDLEAQNVIDTAKNATGLIDGTMIIGPGPDGRQATIPSRPADLSRGEHMFLTRDDNGVVRATISQGVAVEGVAMGQTVNTWGFYFPDQGIWVDKSTGERYTTPPFSGANGNKIEIGPDGQQRIRVDQEESVLDEPGEQKPWTPLRTSATNGQGKVIEPEKVSFADAVLGKTSGSSKNSSGSIEAISAGFRPGGLAGAGAIKALLSVVDEEKAKEITEAIEIYQQGQNLYNQFRAGERNMEISENKANLSSFDTFLGQNSNFQGKQYKKEVLVIRNGRPEWRAIPYRDAYIEKEPGLFVRKDQATEVSSFGKKLDESSQSFPAVIDVRKSIDAPNVKPYLESTFLDKKDVKPADSSMNYFFRKVGFTGYAEDTRSEALGATRAAMATGVTAPRVSTTPSLPGYANPNYGTVSTGRDFGTPLTLAIPKFTAPTMPVVSAAQRAGLGVSEGDTQAELLGQLRALGTPGFSMPNVGGSTKTTPLGGSSSGNINLKV